MTISWISALDNAGHFTMSMNQNRFSAHNLAACPFFVLSVACAGLEPLLTRCGSCTGRGIADKPRALGVPLCRPGWTTLADDGALAVDSSVPAAGVHEEAGQEGLDDEEVQDAASSPASTPTQWPVDGTIELPPVTPAALEQARDAAFAVTPGVAHILARVLTVRGIHGHYLIVAETLEAYAKADYWSSKTLEPQHQGLPPILSFLGSQRFYWQQRPADAKDSKTVGLEHVE